MPSSRGAQASLGLTLLFTGSALSGCIQIGPSDDMDDTSNEPAPFAGSWSYTDTAFNCVHTLILGKREGLDSYEIDLACSLTQGGVGIQIETGEYSVAEEGETTFVPRRATCTGGRVKMHTDTLEQLSTSLLRVKNSEGTIVYEPSSPTGLGTQVVLGCYSADGSFTPGPLTDL